MWWPRDPLSANDIDATIDVLIPAYNEAASLPHVLEALPSDWLRQTIVVDNGSTDRTADAARAHGARVVHESQQGYGAACLTGIDALRDNPPDILTFLDADFSDLPQQLPRLIEPIIQQQIDLVVGSRMVGAREPGALKIQARFGNWLACRLIDVMYGYRFTDLGPFRAIRWPALMAMQMEDEDFGWTVEMQMKAAQHQMDCVEVPVDYRKRRAGHSKVTGTLQGTLQAGVKILWTLGRGYLEHTPNR
jgi:glycosyltransferase involved in cell wall biosynthesis